MKRSNLIDQKTYKKIYSLVPIPCIDILITHHNKFLLGKRVQKPAQKQWFVPGGRIFKNETLTQAARRKVKEELGINIRVSDLKFLNAQQTIFKDSALGGPIHTVNIVFLLPLKLKPKINFDRKYHSKMKWFSEIDKNWHPYVKTVLETAGF
jgi:colanic acid biosynthesis protein WcaH